MTTKQAIVASLSPDLLHQQYRYLKDIHHVAGHCYVASEAYYHLMGGKEAGLTPKSIKHGGTTHWYIETCKGEVIDLTAEQFNVPVPYQKGRGRGFCTKNPSKQALELMRRVRKIQLTSI